MMKSFSQRDNAWAYFNIGNSKLSIGRFGCTITCIADLSTYFGEDLTPNDVNQRCLFTSGGLIYWSSCHFDRFHFERREYSRNDEGIKRALQDPSAAVILQVDNASHWVVATGWQKEANTYKIADPWFGDWANLIRYKNDITGAAYFRRN